MPLVAASCNSQKENKTYEFKDLGKTDVDLSQSQYTLSDDLTFNVKTAKVNILEKDWFNKLDKKDGKEFIWYSYSNDAFIGEHEEGKKWYDGVQLFKIDGIAGKEAQAVAESAIFNEKNKWKTTSKMEVAKDSTNKTIEFKFRIFNFTEKKISSHVYSLKLKAE